MSLTIFEYTFKELLMWLSSGIYSNTTFKVNLSFFPSFFPSLLHLLTFCFLFRSKFNKLECEWCIKSRFHRLDLQKTNFKTKLGSLSCVISPIWWQIFPALNQFFVHCMLSSHIHTLDQMYKYFPVCRLANHNRMWTAKWIAIYCKIRGNAV